MRIPSNILTFAKSESEQIAYKMFRDYFNHYKSSQGIKNLEFSSVKSDGTPITFEEKEEKMNAALRKEVCRIAGVQDFSELPIEQWSMNPQIKWATFAVVSAMIDMVLPESIVDTIGIYTDVRTSGWGDSFSFDVKPRDLFVVSKAGRGQRTAELTQQYEGAVTIVPEMREISVYVSLYKVLAGKESLAEFVAKAIRSIETQMSVDVYGAFATAMDALPTTSTTGLKVAGYTQSDLVSLCQRVTGWNGGAKAIVMGTQLALSQVLPDDVNYRYVLESDYVKVGYVKTAFGYDVMALPQVMDINTPWGTVLADNRLWIVSPSSQKLVKLCLEGSTLANMDGNYDKANLTQAATIWKSWGVGIATNSVAGVITL